MTVVDALVCSVPGLGVWLTGAGEATIMFGGAGSHLGGVLGWGRQFGSASPQVNVSTG